MSSEQSQNVPIAIIGIGCIFAQSPDLTGFLRLLMEGVDAISDPPETHRHLLDFYDPDPKKADHIYSNRGGYLPRVDFDPTEFAIPPAALEATDTSQLLGLLVAKQALRDAGYGDDEGRAFDRSKTSVILGVTGTQELVIPLGARLGHPVWRRALAESGIPEEKAEEIIGRIANGFVPWQENSFPGLLGNVVAGRIANRLDLGGTNCVVDAACASSMSAIHMAVMELTANRSDMVLTGGVDTLNDAFMHMCFSKTKILSTSGDIRPFSREADGTALGEGIGMVVLKRLEDARKDGDRVYAVIKGIGSGSDGKSQSIYAPRQSGQVLALSRAYQQADVVPESIELVEAHGTGTRVGDQVEFKALCEVFGAVSPNGNRCALGSVKSNIGHTKAAAGTAGLIKTALALYHKILPPTLKADPVDPNLGVDQSPFYLNHRLRPWPSADGHVRRAGVSAFGFGGSNFHTVLEENDAGKDQPSWNGAVEIIAFSGDTREEVATQLSQFENALTRNDSAGTAARLAAESRISFSAKAPHRLLMVFTSNDPADALAKRCATTRSNYLHGDPVGANPMDTAFAGCNAPEGTVAFVFPGQGSQYVGMARDLICCFPASLKAFEEAQGALEADQPLSEYTFPRLTGDADRFEERLRKTDIAQPAIGATSVAMLEALSYFGVTPAATAGHSYGELAALHAAGWIDRRTLWRLSVARGQLMAQAGNNSDDAGSMLAVSAPLPELERLVRESGEDVVLANRNSPRQGVLSGATDAIRAIEAKCNTKGWKSVRLPVAAAFHSRMVADAQVPFGKLVADAVVTPGETPVMSNTTGGPYPADADQARRILGSQLARPVDFVADIEALYAMGVRTFIEVGPRSVLTRLIQNILSGREFEAMALDRSGGRKSGMMDLACTLARLAAQGYAVKLDRWERQISQARTLRMRVPLSGANYRTPSAPTAHQPHAPKPDRQKEPKAATSPSRPGAKAGTVSAPTAPNLTAPPSPAVRKADGANTPTFKRDNMKPPANNHLIQALGTVQQSLTAMQALQAQTTQAHEKYLETQAEAHRTLQQMMASTHQLAAALTGTQSSAATGRATLPAMDAKAVPTIPAPSLPVTHDHHRAPQEPATEKAIDASQSPQPAQPEDRSAPPADAQTPGVAEHLIDIVGRLTGYPPEMLGLEMDIEGDLGIDSIKRVEILSALEEQMPHLPKVTPDLMGTLKTLGQICDYLSVNGNTAEQPSQLTATAGPVADEIQATMVRIVSSLTGYPPEMLDLEMDIEADLGIDSIKRVEILSALEEQMPHLPKVTPDMVGTLKTLGQICEYLSSGSGAAPPPRPSDAGSSAADEIQATMVQIVSALTGYPPEMLGMEMDIEADLGIDSIKRVEILSALEEQMPHLPKVTPDMVGTLKSLGSICEYLSGNDTGNAPSAAPPAAVPVLKPVNDITAAVSNETAVDRYEIEVVSRSWDSGGEFAPAPGHSLLVVTEDTPLGQALAGELKARGLKAAFLAPSDAFPGDHRIAGLVIAAPISAAQAFHWAQAAAPHLEGAARTGHAFFHTVTRLDGAFGFSGQTIDAPEQGALSGLAKTAGLEWPSVRCRAIDLAPQWPDPEAAAGALAEEIVARFTEASVEIGLSSDRRVGLEMVAGSAPAGETPLSLADGEVVVVSGGGRGVTAAAALTLAKRTGCALALLGRSAEPQAEPQWLAGLDEQAQIKQAILQNEFADRPASPKALEQSYRRWMANREIMDTLDQCRALGIRARYFCQDVCDVATLSQTMARIRQDLGPIKGLIHGAGILEDRYITDKTLEQFQAVYNTKVKGLLSLLEALTEDDLRHLVIFSSVSARMGNTGQADYAMANEAVNKIAIRQSHQRPGCTVRAINWGPWDGGMVSPSLKRNFERQGVRLIPIDQGAAAMVAEMQTSGASVEVVIGGPLPATTAAVPPESAASPKSETIEEALLQAARRDIDLANCPVLQSHMLDGRPVVPLALMTEWLAHGALHANPGLLLHGMDHLRLLKGITLDVDDRAKTIRLMAGSPKRREDIYEVDVQIRDGGQNGSSLIHSSAKAILTDRLPGPPPFEENGHFKTTATTPALDDIYDRILFHGEAFKGIRQIIHLSEHGMTAQVQCAPPPEKWLDEPLRSRWIADPLVLDCAFQMAIVWCHQNKGVVSLPSYAASYRQYRDRFPVDGVTAVLEVMNVTDRKMTADFTFLDQNKTVIARMTGYEAIMDQGLSRAFGVKAA